MIPTGDHSSRSIVHGRVSSWASWSEAATTNRDDEESESLDLVSQDLSRPLLPELEYEDSDDGLLSIVSEYLPKTNWRLWLVFLVLVLSGVSNVVLAKLQAVPMYVGVEKVYKGKGITNSFSLLVFPKNTGTTIQLFSMFMPMACLF